MFAASAIIEQSMFQEHPHAESCRLVSLQLCCFPLGSKESAQLLEDVLRNRVLALALDKQARFGEKRPD